MADSVKGFFISIEGMDGSGKSTQVDLLKEYLGERLGDRDLYFFREPGGTSIGESVREILKDPQFTMMTDACELLLFSAGRAQLCREKIIPLLERGCVVIADRFRDSTAVYQGFARGIDEKIVDSISDFACKGLKPDLTIYLKISPEQAHARIKQRESSKDDRLDQEGLEFLRKVEDGYNRLIESDKGRFVIIDAEKSVDDIHKDIVNTVLKYQK